MTIPDLLARALAQDASRPLITFYDDATGERIELSVTTTANWVSKTANMLQDSLGAESGSTVGIALPAHWSKVVWLLAAWSVGCVVQGPEDSGTATGPDIAVVGPEVDDTERADEVVALSLRPLGARFTEPLPVGVVDYNAEVLGHGDRFEPYDRPSGTTAALRLDGSVLDHAACITRATTRAAAWGLEPGARILTDGGASLADAVDLAVAALVLDGSLVLVTGADADRLSKLAADERTTALVTLSP